MIIAKILIIFIIIFIIIIIIYSYVSTNMTDYLLRIIHINLLKNQTITYNNDRALHHAATCFKYCVIINNKKYNNFTILKNILNNTDETVDVTDRWSKQINIPREITMSLYILNYVYDISLMKDLFRLFLIWSPNPFFVGNTLSRERTIFIYSKCLSYIIMFKLNKKYSLNLNIDEDIYNECLNFFTTELEILSCKILSNEPGYYSDGSYTYGTPMIPAAILNGSNILDNLLFLKFVVDININTNLLNSYLFMLEREVNFYGCFIDTFGRNFTRSSARLHLTQIIFQIGACISFDIINVTSTKILLKYPYLYNTYFNLPENAYPVLRKNIPYVKNNVKLFSTLTVNGIVRCTMNGFGITSSNYTSFCYVNDQIGHGELLRITTQFSRYCIQLTDPNSYEYYFESNNMSNGIIYNIQNILIDDIMIVPMDRDHALLGYQLNESEIFVAKGLTFDNGRLQSYEILSDNSIISVNHITLSSHEDISNIKFVVFRWILTDYDLSQNDTVLKISNYVVYSQYPIEIIRFNRYLIFYSNIPIESDMIISFSVNRNLSSIIIKPDEYTICSGLFEIKERRNNLYQQQYEVVPSDFDLNGTHYFELLYPIKRGFILYGPWDNVAISIDNKTVNILDNGVRYIDL
jgi:hypothetical protein